MEIQQAKTQFACQWLLKAVWSLVFYAFLVSPGYAQLGLRPVITSQPADTVVPDNDSATFRVEASSLTFMSYKWYHNSNLISGATASSYTINPAQLSGGDDGFYHVQVINLAGSTMSRVAKLTILASNDIPVANDDTYTTQGGVPLTIPAPGILANDVDLYPGPLTALLVSNPSRGSLSLNTDGAFTYNPNSNYLGSDSFTYRTRDGGTTILERNSSGGDRREIKSDQPGAQSFRHGMAGDPDYSVKKVVLRLSKKSGQTNNLNFSIGTGVNSGTIAGSGYTITMASISNTTEGASFQVYDIVYATPVGPLTAGTAYYLNLGNSPNGQSVFVECANSSTYPRGTYYRDGSDDSKDMRFEIHEETFSASATVTLNMILVYNPPIAVNDTAVTPEDVSATINVLANDRSPVGLPLTIVDTFSTNGNAIVSGTNIVFSPSPDFNGTAVFSYTISDGTSFSTASVAVNVTPMSDYPPVANDDTYSTAENTTLVIPAAGVLANDYDGEGDTMMASLVSNVTNGSLTLNPNGSFTYTPKPNYNGADSFSYRATDGGTTAPAILQESVVSRVKVEIKAGQKGAQSFRVGAVGGKSYTITKVLLNLSREATAPNTNLNFFIGTGVNAGAIPGSSVTIPPSSITNVSSGSSFQPYEIVFDAGVGPLTAGMTYYLNLECEPSNLKRIWSDYDDQSNYTNGTYYKGGSDDRKDITFQISGFTNSDTAFVMITVTPRNELLRFVSQQWKTNGIELELSGPGASTYYIEASTNLTDWTPIHSDYTASGRLVFIDTRAISNSVCFYRAMIAAVTNR